MKMNMDSYSMESKQKISGKFINRELSWLSFNARVLYYVKDKKLPLNERLKFLAITESNLDEFIGVRLAYVYKNQDKEPYKEILSEIKKFKKSQEAIFSDLKDYLADKKKLKIVKVKNLDKKEKSKLYDYYYNNIFPLLTPVIINSANFSPNLMSGQLSIAVTMKRDNKESLCVIPIFSDTDHMIRVNDNHVVLIEDVIKEFCGKSLFINEEITNICTFRLIKDASVLLSHDNNKFIVDRMKDVIDKRKQSEPMFMEIEKDASQELTHILTSAFGVPGKHIYYSSEMLKYKRFMDPIFSSKESYKPFEPFVFENYENYDTIFDALQERDVLLHHPYDSYDTVVRFIEQAAHDKHVVAIKQTLYRVSSIDSPIVNALCYAAQSGKKVSVLIEIKARFDEENNINLIEKLKHAGATVLLGTEYLKTHCKMCIVIRKENDGLKVYSHMGTGNYNEKTARQYTDLSFLTSKRKLGTDLLNIFNILSGHSRPDNKLEKIAYSPVTLRKTLEKNIDREIKHAKNGKHAEIFIKVNSISDPIIDKLYKAASEGVKVYIICRGICSIVPKKNLYIKSIVGRFLEHSRIYYFSNNGNPEYFISSADLLTRNLDRRVEVLISLKDSSVIKQIKWIIKVFKEDKANSFIMDSDGKWKHSDGSFDAHDWFIQYSDTKKKKKKWNK
jgi:polyphosphate kinase